jgi:YD repeat-containing protein
MTYNGDGQRIVRQTSTGRTTFDWDGSDYLGEVNS